MLKPLWGVAIVLLAMAAIAEEIDCYGWLSGSFDNVNVSPGAACTLSDAYVKANITVRTDASLNVHGETLVRGNVQAEGARHVRLLGRGVHVDGNVRSRTATEQLSSVLTRRLAGVSSMSRTTGSWRSWELTPARMYRSSKIKVVHRFTGM
jgi:hypothetical protein